MLVLLFTVSKVNVFWGSQHSLLLHFVHLSQKKAVISTLGFFLLGGLIFLGKIAQTSGYCDLVISSIQDKLSPDSIVLWAPIVKKRVGEIRHSFTTETVPTAEEHCILYTKWQIQRQMWIAKRTRFRLKKQYNPYNKQNSERSFKIKCLYTHQTPKKQNLIIYFIFIKKGKSSVDPIIDLI